MFPRCQPFPRGQKEAPRGNSRTIERKTKEGPEVADPGAFKSALASEPPVSISLGKGRQLNTKGYSHVGTPRLQFLQV